MWRNCDQIGGGVGRSRLVEDGVVDEKEVEVRSRTTRGSGVVLKAAQPEEHWR